MLRRVSKFKTYKEFFNDIEDEWERSYFMEDDFAGKEDTQSAAVEVDEIYAWKETATDNPTETEMLAEVNRVYHRYGMDPNHRASKPHSGEAEEARDHSTPDTTIPGT